MLCIIENSCSNSLAFATNFVEEFDSLKSIQNCDKMLDVIMAWPMELFAKLG